MTTHKSNTIFVTYCLVAALGLFCLAETAQATVIDDFTGPAVDPSWGETDSAPLNAPPAASIYTQSATAGAGGASDVLARLIGDDSSWTATLDLSSIASLTGSSAFNFSFADPGTVDSHSFIIVPAAGFFFSSTAGSGFTSLVGGPLAIPFAGPSTISVSWLDPDGPGVLTGAFTTSWSLDGGTHVGASAALPITVNADPGRAVSINTTGVSGTATVGIDRYADDSSTGAPLSGGGAVPEPSTLVLAGISLLGLGMTHRRRRR